MDIKKSIILLLLFSTCIIIVADEIKSQYTSVFITGYIDASEGIKADNNLDFTSFGVKTYTTTKWGLRIGGGISILVSSSELIEGENSSIYGGIFAGGFLGQELRIWQITLSINLFLGVGASISNLWSSPRHIDYFGEINVDTGFFILENFSITAFAGFQSIGNLFPQFPGTAYLMYYPVWGIALTW